MPKPVDPCLTVPKRCGDARAILPSIQNKIWNNCFQPQNGARYGENLQYDVRHRYRGVSPRRISRHRVDGSAVVRLDEEPDKSRLFDFAECAQTLEGQFGNNIESVFQGIASAINRRQPGYSVFANCFRPTLLQAMRQWFAGIHRQHPSRAYEQFAQEIVRPGDQIITFNYDVSLDSQMRRFGKWCVGDGYGFRAEALPCGSAVSILKLHGSINWFAPLFAGMTGMFAAPACGSLGSRPAFTDGDLSALGYVGVVDPLFPRQGSAALQSLILPTNRKQFYFQSNFGREWSGFWERLWRPQEHGGRFTCGVGKSGCECVGLGVFLHPQLRRLPNESIAGEGATIPSRCDIAR